MGEFTFSEHGEDILIHRLLYWKKCGFYVDVGCYHPRNMSLTARLRNYGWQGLNIDADSRVIEIFEKEMPHMRNVNVAISDREGDVRLYRFDDPVINTISDEQNKHLQNIEKTAGLFTARKDSDFVKASKLSDVIDMCSVENIDFLNLDIEGAEILAINGFNWGKYNPVVVACEIHELDLMDIAGNDVVYKMYELGYILQSYVFHTAIFIKKNHSVEYCHRLKFETL